MNREIRFRGWNTIAKEWEKVLDIFVGENGEILLTDGDHVWRDVKGLEISQYTGLKDKNGTDVYQGDIIRCTRGCPHEVIWLEEYAGTYIGGMPAWYLSGLNQGYAWTGDEEVIGNVYEHSHLLEEVEGES